MHLSILKPFISFREALEDYDYSHLMKELLSTEKKSKQKVMDVSFPQNTAEETSGGPEAEKVIYENPEAPIYSGNVFGNVNFLCKMSLAVNEVAVIQVPSRLSENTISSK